ncbi:hypothetical protein ACI2IX_20055 [Leifsonia aquatica]|uniref:hypothetical protein n=1 Tax=Leifsonia aquatica TaxID=144185 RepID=UPI00384C112B
MKTAVAIIAAPVLAIALLVTIALAAITGGGNTCSGAGTGQVAVTATGTLPEAVGRWSGPQLQMAATLMTAANAAGVNTHAQEVLVMTAMGESSLSNPNHGDAVDDTTIGVLQQGASYGPVSARMDPTTAATAFLTRLQGVKGWEQMEPTLAAHAVQRNQDPFHYRPFFTDAQAVVAALSGTSAQTCQVAGDAASLAKELMAAHQAGTFTDRVEPGLINAVILPIAEGRATPTCQVDTRVLQILVLTLQKFGKVGISDLNRPCIGSSQNCAFSAHCFQPSTAIDFSSLGDDILTGANQASMNLLTHVGPMLPTGSQIGQSDCRAAAGTSIDLPGIRQISDRCNHLHVDLQHTTDQLHLTTN